LEIAVVHYNDGNYSLQLGAFLTEYQAEILVKKIGLRLDDVSLHIDIENKYYKVRTPIVGTRGEAVKLARKIQSLGLLK
jgi:cell division protein FtsN